jgi:hypothetical protein
MSDGKPCTFCAVGWMSRHRVRDILLRLWIVWLCNACGRQEKEAAE